MATLLLENGPNRGKGLDLKPGATYTLGRDPNCDLVLHGELVSRQHCRVKEFKGAFYVKDLDSLNGVSVNDQRVTQVEIKPGDKLQLGEAVLTFLDESLAKAKEEKILGGYRLLERVGRGGMGTVYRAIQISLDREVALKVLSPELVKDKAFVEQFFREARAAGQLNHPHIVQVYDVGQEGDTFYYSMEFVRGGSLEDKLRATGTLPVEEVLRIAHEAATALEYAETRGIVHRDIKPDNLMLAEDGRVRVADLGLALSLKSTADTKGQPILGTPHFISPEQALRREIDIRSDIYSLGATMYRMLAGRTVFTGASAEEIIRKAVRDEPQPLRELNAEVPEKVAALIQRMLKKSPDERFASARELREQLDVLTRRPVHTKKLIAAIAVAVLAVGTTIVIALNRPDPVVIRDPGNDLQAKIDRYNAQNDAEKRRQDLEAVRGYLALFEEPRDRAALRESLGTWLSSYVFTNVPECARARTKLEEIDTAIGREEAAANAAKAARTGKVATARDGVTALLEQGDLVGALTRASAIDPATESDPETRTLLTAERTRLIGVAHDRIVAERTSLDQKIDAAVAANDLAAAVQLCHSAEASMTLPPIDAGAPVTASAIDEALRSELAEIATAYLKRRTELESRADEVTQAARVRESERLVRALAEPTRQAVLILDLEAAALMIDAVIAESETDSARSQLAPITRVLHRGQLLVERLFAGIEAKTVPSEPALHLASLDRGGELVDIDREKRLLKLRMTAGGRGFTSSTVPFSELATADGLRQLFVGRLELTPDERLDLAELMAVVEVLRWAEGLAPLAARLVNYDPKNGWGDEQRANLPVPIDGALADAVDAVLKEIPVANADAATALRARARSEELCQDELKVALDPFVNRESSIGWTASVEALRHLLDDRRDTLLLQVVRPWIIGT